MSFYNTSDKPTQKLGLNHFGSNWHAKPECVVSAPAAGCTLGVSQSAASVPTQKFVKLFVTFFAVIPALRPCSGQTPAGIQSL